MKANDLALWALLVACAGCSGGSGTGLHVGDNFGSGGAAGAGADWTQWPGFQRLTELGPRCSASLAEKPGDANEPLTWIPCASGVTGCEQLRWDGALKWDPVGSGDMLEFHGRFARDASGRLSRLLVMHRYPRGPGYQGIPFEAVVYDVPTGAPLAAFRNFGDSGPQQSSGDGTISGGSGGAECEIELGVSDGAVWIVGAASGGGRVLVGRAPLPGTPTAPALRLAKASAAVIDGAVVASDDLVGLEDSDGAIVRAGKDASLDATVYGPGVRVWLDGAVGTDLLAYNDKAAGDAQLFRLGRDGAFVPMPSRGSLVRTDGVRIAWIEPTATGVSVWARPYDPAATGLDGAAQVATIADARPFTEAMLADGTLALVAHPSQASFTGPQTVAVYLVDLAAGTVRTRDLGREPILRDERAFVAASATHVYVAESPGTTTSLLLRYAVN